MDRANYPGAVYVDLLEQVSDGVYFVSTERRITYWTPAPNDELPTGLGCADVFVSPSVGEAFGQVFIEAMACGLPVVAAASGGPLAFVNDDPTTPNGWLVTPDDETALAAALAESTGPKAGTERATRATNALAQVRPRFTWPGAVRQVVELYDHVSAPHTRHPG